jgi:hypothetical protein
MVIFRKATSKDPAKDPEKGEYVQTDAVFFANGLVAIVCCPSCGASSMVGRAHRVANNGEVSPSFVCPHPPCTFHEWITLADWPKTGEVS